MPHPAPPTPTTDGPQARLRCFLAGLSLFSDLPEVTLDELAARAESVALAGGTTLLEQGTASDAFLVLRWGRLAAWRTGEDGQTRRLGQISPGECVGEVGLILDQPRTATVFALRDSELVRWSRSEFEQLIAHHPAAMLRLTREALKRYAATAHRPAEVRCIAVLPGTPGVDAVAFARRLARALPWLGKVRVVEADEARSRSGGWFSRMEQEGRGLVYVGDDDPAWRERCVRQSDAVLMLADTDDKPDHVLPSPDALSPHLPLHLVLLRRDVPAAGSTHAWLEAFPGRAMHHHVIDDNDLARCARLLGGRATGLVLSGGGARGFAHIGAIRALREHRIQADYIGGCSAGAVVGAGVAAGWDEAHLVRAMRTAFVDHDPLSDRTLPLVAMSSGRRVSRALRAMYGEHRIEDLRIPFFCVSTDLTGGKLHVHDRGSLWIALRAGSALPGLVPPVFHDHRVLVDGGVIDNLPVDEMQHRLSGAIVAVDVGGSYRLETTLEETALPSSWLEFLRQWRQKKYPGIGRILWRAAMVNSDANAARQRKLSSLLLRPPLAGIDLLDWKKFDQVVELGYRDTLRHLDAHPEALATAAWNPDDQAARG